MDEKVKEIEGRWRYTIAGLEGWTVPEDTAVEDVQYLLSKVKELEEGIKEIYTTMNQYPMATYSLRMTIQKAFKLVEKKKGG